MLTDLSAEYTFAIMGTDTDNRDRLQMSALFSYMQEAAFRHFYQRSGQSDLGEQGLHWILVRLSVELIRQPLWQDQIVVKTELKGLKRLTFIRWFQFLDQQGNVLGEATSEWLVVDQLKRKPVRLPAEWTARLPVADAVSSCPRLQPFTKPEDQATLKKYADFSDIDRNQHVNNTRYVAWSIDALQRLRHQGHSQTPPFVGLKDFVIHYRKEAYWGDRLNIYCRQDPAQDLTYYIEGSNSVNGAVIFLARATLFEPEPAAEI